MKALSTDKVRHVLLRADSGESLPDALRTELRDQAVTCGWFRGSGVLADVELCAYDADKGALAAPRKIAGPVHALVLEGSIGLSAGDVSFGMRAVIAREGDRGLETLAGELVGARVVGLEVLVAAFDEHAVPRMVDPASQVWLLGETSPTGTVMRGGAPAEWRAAAAASAAAPERPNPQPGPPPMTAQIPQRPVRPKEPEAESVLPEAGDVVDHFAFGKCDVLKTDGDRLYLRMHKDGRIKEIALEMLRVTSLGEEDGKRAYKLARRI